jgi:hypothetical protein
MDMGKPLFWQRTQVRQDQIIHENLPLFKFGYHFFSVVIPLFMLAWIGVAGGIIFQVVREISSTGTPLVVNRAQTTWAGTAAYVGVAFGMMLFGLLCMWLGLRQVRKTWGRQFKRIEKDT